jgi:hypothetical protein
MQIKYAIIQLQNTILLSVHCIWKVMATSPKSKSKYCKLNQKLRQSFCTVNYIQQTFIIKKNNINSILLFHYSITPVTKYSESLD